MNLIRRPDQVQGVALPAASFGAIDRACGTRELVVRTTLAIDDDLLDRARRLSGVQEKSALVREGLKALIERESVRRLARLGGSERELVPIPRRQAEAILRR